MEKTVTYFSLVCNNGLLRTSRGLRLNNKTPRSFFSRNYNDPNNWVPPPCTILWKFTTKNYSFAGLWNLTNPDIWFLPEVLNKKYVYVIIFICIYIYLYIQIMKNFFKKTKFKTTQVLWKKKAEFLDLQKIAS